MRSLLSALLVIASVCSAWAEGKVKPHLASEAEIRQLLHGTNKLKQRKNGYQYRAGSNIGYKIADGKICVLQSGRSSCFTVYSEGRRLEIVDAKGNRDFLN